MGRWAGICPRRRRTTEHGTVQLPGHTFTVAPLWPHRLVRCEVDLAAGP
jgi:hypothetical protein